MRRKVFPTLSMKNEEVIITNIGLFRLVFLLFVIFFPMATERNN